MGTIFLKKQSLPQAILLPCDFIEKYMAQANGEFVKVYLCLLYRFSLGEDLDFAHLADTLMCTEGDIIRALRYWENLGLVRMTLQEKEGKKTEIVSICLCDPADSQSASAQDCSAPDLLPDEADPKADPAGGASERVTPIRSERRNSMTPDRVKELKENEDVAQLLYIAEQYLSKTLTANEIQRILLFYDELHMSIDLIDYLIEYCVSRGHNSIHYIETVAHAWAKEGITTVTMAKQISSENRKEYFPVLRALGITGRGPVSSEKTYMETWFDTYGFSLEIILEACSRTVISTGKGSFQYADSILKGWFRKKVHSLEDIRALDDEHARRSAAAQRARTQPASPHANRFNNFTQRQYDYDEIERKLLSQ